MMAALARLAPCRMSVAEFLDWPGDGSGRKFELIDGEPQAMAPASITHGIIQANVAGILRAHLIGSGCMVVIEPGLVPRIRSDANVRIPDLAATCEADDAGLRALAEPTVVVEILSPSNEAETRANVWAYTTIPAVREILLLRSTSMAAELLQRDADGSWPATARLLAKDEILSLESLDFSCPLAALYDGTYLAR
jgi:Uma2 family endonuclease